MSTLQICRKGQNCLVCDYNNWTNGMKRLKDMGFTVYQKDHQAFKGEINWNKQKTGILVEASIEIRHDRQTDKWEIEFHAFYGKQQFSVEKTEKVVKCGVAGLQEDWNDFGRRFRQEHATQINIINNIFRNKE